MQIRRTHRQQSVWRRIATTVALGTRRHVGSIFRGKRSFASLDKLFFEDYATRKRRLFTTDHLIQEVVTRFRNPMDTSLTTYLMRRCLFNIYTKEFVDVLARLLGEINPPQHPIVDAGAGDGSLSDFLSHHGLNLKPVDLRIKGRSGGLGEQFYIPPFVENCDIFDAIDSSQPHVVIAGWPQFSVNRLLDRPSVRYIVVIGQGSRQEKPPGFQGYEIRSLAPFSFTRCCTPLLYHLWAGTPVAERSFDMVEDNHVSLHIRPDFLGIVPRLNQKGFGLADYTYP